MIKKCKNYTKIPNYHIFGPEPKSVVQAPSLHCTYSLYQILKESVKASTGMHDNKKISKSYKKNCIISTFKKSLWMNVHSHGWTCLILRSLSSTNIIQYKFKTHV